jgi:hypothetical protein
MTARQHAWRSNGTCLRCEVDKSWPAAKRRCDGVSVRPDRDAHYLARDAGYQRRLYWKRRSAPVYRCTVCRELGHNARTCAEKREVAL